MQMTRFFREHFSITADQVFIKKKKDETVYSGTLLSSTPTQIDIHGKAAR
jgi:hypothetical protein